MKNPLENYTVYIKALEFYDRVIEDTELLGRDYRGREIVRQLIRSAGAISANIEEGFGRGTAKEFIYFLNVAKGSARETKGWYRRSKRFLPDQLIEKRQREADELIALLVSTVNTLTSTQKLKARAKG